MSLIDDSVPPYPAQRNDEIILAVMGATGAGKSSFLNKVSGSNFGIGHGLQSKTDSVQVESFDYKGRTITLVDTPGFDDTKKTDTEILRIIAGWLEVTYNNNQKLTGLLYPHRIIDNRVGGVSYKNLKLFGKLCGSQAMDHVVLCTTMWDQIDEQKAAEREAELKGDFWKEMVASGAKIARHNNTVESAQAVIDSFLNLGKVELKVQKELNAGASLLETAAGSEINKELMEMQARHQRELAEARADMEEAMREKDERMQKMIREEQGRLEKRLEQAENDRRRLVQERGEEMARMQQQLDELKRKKSGGGCAIM